AYRVAALDAISRAHGSRKTISEFIRKFANPAPDRDRLIDYLWGVIRSAHFHSGEFPLGEFSSGRFFEPLIDAEQTTQEELHLACHVLTREVIVKWVDEEVARSSDSEYSDDAWYVLSPGKC